MCRLQSSRLEERSVNQQENQHKVALFVSLLEILQIYKLDPIICIDTVHTSKGITYSEMHLKCTRSHHIAVNFI